MNDWQERWQESGMDEHHEQEATLRYKLGPEDEGMLLRTILRSRLNVSRRLMTKLKTVDQGITVNGKRLYMDAKLHAGDIVELRLPTETSETIEPQPMELDILYEDRDLLAVNKPAGLIVHPTLGHWKDTLANGVMYYWQERGESYRFRPVHRLDELTSGVVLIAKNAYAHQQLSIQLQQRSVVKEYVAFVHGVVAEPFGTITGPIDRDPEQPHMRIVTETGYPALTSYEVVQTYREASKVKVLLGTGRTHQIRVHMRWLGHPLIGDPVYTLPEYDNKPYAGIMDRQALHAERIEFTHPLTGQRVSIEAPLAKDLLGLQAYLEQA